MGDNLFGDIRLGIRQTMIPFGDRDILVRSTKGYTRSEYRVLHLFEVLWVVFSFGEWDKQYSIKLYSIYDIYFIKLGFVS